MFPDLPPATRALILANAAAFAFQALSGDMLTLAFALWPLGSAAAGAGIPGFQPWQVLTYSFLHANVLHLAVNMYALYMFGGALEMLWGPRRYLSLYFASVITAAIAQLIYSGLAGGTPYPTLGASGGVFGMLLSYAMVFPNRMIVLLIPPIPMPAWLFVTLYGLLELYLGITGTQEGVAHFAHLGGMVGAWSLIRYWRAGRPYRRR